MSEILLEYNVDYMYAKSTKQTESQSFTLFTEERKTFSFQRKLRSKHLFCTTLNIFATKNKLYSTTILKFFISCINDDYWGLVLKCPEKPNIYCVGYSGSGGTLGKEGNFPG